MDQLSMEQKKNIQDKILDLTKKVDKSISIAYCLVVKAGTMGKIEKLHIKQFRDSIDIQFNANIIQQLKDEEWLLEGVGYGLLQSNGLIPTVDNPVKVKFRTSSNLMVTSLLLIQQRLTYAFLYSGGRSFARIKEGSKYIHYMMLRHRFQRFFILPQLLYTTQRQ